MDKYGIRNVCLGEGSYGIVHRYIDKDKTYAIKKIACTGLDSPTIIELSLLSKLKHPNIITLLDIFITHASPTSLQYTVYMVMSHGDIDLRSYLKDRTVPLDAPLVKSYLYQLLLAIEYCHRNHVWHLDIKPGNLLITRDGSLWLADFGISKGNVYDGDLHELQAFSIWYRPPEICAGLSNYGKAADIWAIGCIFAEMLTLKPLFNGYTSKEMYALQLKLLSASNFGTFYETILAVSNDQGFDLLSKFLSMYPHRRISASQALLHPYFDNTRPLFEDTVGIDIKDEKLISDKPLDFGLYSEFLEWLLDQQMIADDIYFLTINLLVQYLNTINTTNELTQLDMTACYHLASLYYDVNSTDIDWRMTKYPRVDICQAKVKLAQAINFNICTLTWYDLFRFRIINDKSISVLTTKLTLLILKLSMMMGSTIFMYLPSDVVDAAFTLSKFILDGSSVLDEIPLVKQIHEFITKLNTPLKHLASLHKQFECYTRTRLKRKL